MNTTQSTWRRTALAAAVAAALLAGCASAPQRPAGSQEVRAKLSELQSDAGYASRAPIAMKEAEQTVTEAERIEPDTVLAAHRVYIANRKVDSARALAETRLAEDERTELTAAAEKARLDSRTREADQAKSDAVMARAENADQKRAADQARTDAMMAQAENADQKRATDQARGDADAAQQQAMELQKQIELLQAKPTDRGLVLMLGDTLFATGKAELKPGAKDNLNRVTAFLNEYPERTAAIEGYTDSAGSEEYNQELSQRRADSVKGYLVGQGVQTTRLSAAGRGENAPVADNASVEGRQQNRRVEVIISKGDGTPGN